MAIETPTWFDANEYYKNKADQLKAVDPDNYGTWDGGTVKDFFISKGIDPYQHFLEYGKAENVAPNAYFDVRFYLRAKADQLNNYENEDGSIGFDGKADWTAADVQKAFTDAGLTAWDHYVQAGAGEGINPSANFDAEAYYAAKMEQLNGLEDGKGFEGHQWTVADVKESFAEAGITPAEHAAAFAKAEKIDVTPSATDPTAADDFDPYAGVITASEFTGTSGDDKILVPAAGAVDIKGLAGDDQVIFSEDGAYIGDIDGGTGKDKIVIKADVDLSGMDTIANVESLDMSAKGAQKATLTAQQFVDFGNGADIVASAKDGDTVILNEALEKADAIIDATGYAGKLQMGSDDIKVKLAISQLANLVDASGTVLVDVATATDIKNVKEQIAKVDELTLTGSTMDISAQDFGAAKIHFADSKIQTVTMTDEQFNNVTEVNDAIHAMTSQDHITVKLSPSVSFDAAADIKDNMHDQLNLVDTLVVVGAVEGSASGVDLHTADTFTGKITLEKGEAKASDYELTLSAAQFKNLTNPTALDSDDTVTIHLSDKADTIKLTNAEDTVIFNDTGFKDVITNFGSGDSIKFDGTTDAAFSGFAVTSSGTEAASGDKVYTLESDAKPISSAAALVDALSGVSLGSGAELVVVSYAKDGTAANIWYVENDGTAGVDASDAIHLIGTVTGGNIEASDFSVLS